MQSSCAHIFQRLLRNQFDADSPLLSWHIARWISQKRHDSFRDHQDNQRAKALFISSSIVHKSMLFTSPRRRCPIETVLWSIQNQRRRRLHCWNRFIKMAILLFYFNLSCMIDDCPSFYFGHRGNVPRLYLHCHWCCGVNIWWLPPLEKGLRRMVGTRFRQDNGFSSRETCQPSIEAG